MATELELKLMVHPNFLKLACDFLDNFCQQSADTNNSRQPTLALMNAYFDTEDALLMQTGIAMRIRSFGSRFIQTVKTRGSSRIGMHARGEWEWEVENDQLDLTLLKEVPLPDVLKDMSWCKNLIEVYRTDFQRQVWNIELSNTQIEVVCDNGLVTSPYGKDTICELELELKSGEETGLYDFALQLAEHIPLQVSVVSKAQKGVRLKYGKIEFPEKPKSIENSLELASYWYEVWLVYWEAMHFMQDEALLQPLSHSMERLQACLPIDLQKRLMELDAEIKQVTLGDSPDLLERLAGEKSIGLAMLTIGQWLNAQAF
ncbi:CYTH domain-containing protein [Marinomonas sp. C2222]|uniref:CYTH domain-containing protein n=1 Tax=Marinomonas sargassi TaxID=2984494 RepID=A0ABT2YVI8_9GAMM|nr:CYTH domain-containing protein [Marinomonas sargassi]MCV2403916.1 CYTH domain-containing protein [Marinomonas sargassi]